jgi:catechol 2,3-dioxygenase-like lactoylglutathione lyase family enzyme
MFKKMECVCMYTTDLDQSLAFYRTMGLKECYRDERRTEAGAPWTLVGLRFPEGGSDLFLQNNPELKATDVEIVVDDVQDSFRQLGALFPGVKWIREPFKAGLGHVAVVELPGGMVVVLVGK